MKRAFFSGSSCPFKCQYCFAGFSQYQPHQAFEVRSLTSDAEIYYPSCDSEAVISNDLLAEVFAAIRQTRANAIVSISTKAPILKAALRCLSEINNYLESEGRGFVKVSVSIPTKSLIGEIEPGTASFAVRRRNLEELAHVGIKTSINLRPLLPFVTDDEYQEIIEETAVLAKRFLLGPLYVDVKSRFFNRWIKGRYHTTLRRVAWASGGPLWHAVESGDQMTRIANVVRECGGRVFDNDGDVIADIRNSLMHVVRASAEAA